jgi:hypothetical protein
MTAFFIPALDPLGASEEDVYAAIRESARTLTGHAPEDDRIVKLMWRRGGTDCSAEVGQPDPVGGQTVLAIVDLGRHGPYVIQCGTHGPSGTQLIVDKPVYSATQFTVADEV